MRALAVAAILCATAPAHADEIDATARADYAQGTRLFEAGDYEGALAKFSSAYSLTHAPALLFDMGQACRALGRRELAAYYYHAYQAAAPTPPTSRGRGTRIAGTVLTGTGAALLATSVYFATSDDDDGRAWSIYTGVTGATLAIGGGVLWYLGAREERQQRLSIAPTRGGARVALTWTF